MRHAILRRWRELLALAEGLPRRSLARGEVLLVDGEPVRALYALLSGALRIEKGGTLIAIQSS
jgi:CRP-like cAMP-binding protein